MTVELTLLNKSYSTYSALKRHLVRLLDWKVRLIWHANYKKTAMWNFRYIKCQFDDIK